MFGYVALLFPSCCFHHDRHLAQNPVARCEVSYKAP